MKRILITLPLLLAAWACERTTVNTLTDEDAVQSVVEGDLGFLMDDMGSMMDEDSSYGAFQAVGLTSPIGGQLRVWYRRIDPSSRRLNLSIQIEGDTAWVDIGRTHAGTFNLWYSPEGDTGRPDTLIRYTKDLSDTLFRKVLLVRQGSPNEFRRGWRIVAFSFAQGHALPTTSLGIDSVVIDFYDHATVADSDTTDGRVDSVVCGGNLLKTIRVSHPDEMISTDSMLTVPARACAHVRVWGSGIGEARGFLHFPRRWRHHVRRPLSWNDQGYWEGTYFTPFFVEEGYNRFHVVLDLIAENTFGDDAAPYDAVFWFIPYRVTPR